MTDQTNKNETPERIETPLTPEEAAILAAYRAGDMETVATFALQNYTAANSPFHVMVRTTGKNLRDGQDVGNDAYRLRRAFAQAGELVLNGFVVIDFDDADWSQQFETLVFTLADSLKQSE